MKSKILQKFYGTWLGGKYLEFVLWLDEQNGGNDIVSSKEMHQIVMQAQQMTYREGMRQMKKNIYSLVNSKTKEEYDAALKKVENLVDLANADESDLTKLRESLYKAFVRTNKIDIASPADHARMLDQRIKDKKELWEHQAKRKMIRDIRSLTKEGKTEEALKLQEEFKERYARRH